MREESNSWKAALKEMAGCVEKQHKNSTLHNARGKPETNLFIKMLENCGELFWK